MTAEPEPAPANLVDIDALLASMTLEEKIGQLNVPVPGFFIGGTGSPTGVPTTSDEIDAFVTGEHVPYLGPGGGFFGMCMSGELSVPEQATRYARLQQLAKQQTRLGIPLLNIAEGYHGVLAPGHTVFPEGLALGSSWDPPLLRRVYAAVAREAAAVGVHLLSTIVVEPMRDPRLGRNCEGYSEDAYLLSEYTEAIVVGIQVDARPARVGALLTCFPGQSEPESGLERGAMEISERTLREVFLPPWEAGLSKAGALAVMASYVSVDGRVTHGSAWLLDSLLRGEFGFEGIVVSEGRGFLTLLYEGIVADQAAAGAVAINAGVDVNITYEDAYLEPLHRQVEAGTIPVALIDRAVRRVLHVKQRLGLFDVDPVDAENADAVVHNDDHVAAALEAARAGIVLLKNEGSVLPLDPSTPRIAVIGPNAHSVPNQLGDYAVTMFRPTLEQGAVTILDGVRAAVPPGVEVVHAVGCDVLGDDRSGFAEAIAAARSADVAIVVVGEQGGYFDPERPPTNGEQNDVADLDLTGLQDELVRAVHATGTPTVVVLINGRPLSTQWIADHVPALVEAWFPGERGGEAVADVLFGVHNPSGRLPVTIPRHVGQLPVHYNHRRARTAIRDADYSFGKPYVDLAATPLFEFGFGLSYTSFEYGAPQVSSARVRRDEAMAVTIDVVNSGSRRGTETVQVYVRDVLASIAPRAQQLCAFAKVELDPGEQRSVRLEIAMDHFSMLDETLTRVIEAGEFELQIGASCQDIRARVRIEVVDD